MKRFLTLFILGMAFCQANAQVLFSQDFESGSIEPMTAIDVDGLPVAPQVANTAGPTWQVVQQTATNRMAVSTSWFAPPGIANDWLISPAITVTDSNTFLIWEAYSPDASYRDGYEVRISTSTTDVDSFDILALNVAAELTTLNKRSLRLDAYVGQTIHFAFRNDSNDKFLLFLDNIRVEHLKKNNAIVRSVSFEKYNTLDVEIPIKVTVENYGGSNINSLLFSYEINSESYTDTVTGLNIAPLRTLDITHTVSFVPSVAGEYPVNIEIAMPNGVEDEEPADNEISRKIYSLTEQLPKKVVVEEATGTWCIWCPRGAVNMDLIAAEYADIVIPIAVHNFDPMVVPEYDTPFSQSVGGYPSGHVDRRVRDIDPSEFANGITQVQNRVVPVGADVQIGWNEETRELTIVGTGYSSVASNGNDWRIAAVVTENHVTGEEDGYAQANIYANNANGPMGGYESLPNPVPADQMVYHFVARAILGGFNGAENSVPDVLAANEEFEFTFTYTVPEEYDFEELFASVMIIDEETGEILNGDILDVSETVSVPVVPTGRLTAYPNPTTDVLNVEVDHQTETVVTLSIFDTYGRLIRTIGQMDLSNGKTTQQVNVSDLASGNYILEIRHKNAVNALPFNKI